MIWGVVVEEKIKYCYNCGKKLPFEANFCVKCGIRQPIIPFDSNSDYQKIARKAESTNVNVQENYKSALLSKVFDNISRSLLFAFSLLMILFAFLPSMTIKYDDCEVAHINTFESIEFMVDSFYSLTEVELKKSELFDDLYQLSKDISKFENKDYSDLSKSELEKLNEYIHLTLKFTLRSELAKPTIDIILNGIFSILYLAFILAFNIVALFNFLGIFIDKFKKTKFATYIFLTIIPGLAIVMYYLTASILSGSIKTVMGSGLILSIVFGLLIIVFELVRNILTHEFKLNTKEIVLNSIKTALCSLIMIFVFSPFTISAIRYSINSENYNVKLDNNVFIFYSFVYGEEDEKLFFNWKKLDMDETKDYFYSLFKTFETNDVEDLKNGNYNANNILFLVFAGATTGLYKSSFPLFVSIPIIVLAGLIFVGFLMQQYLIYFISGKRCKPLTIIFGILQTVIFICTLAFTIVFFIIIQEKSISKYCNEGYVLKIGTGIILLVVFSVLLLIADFITIKNKQDKNIVIN